MLPVYPMQYLQEDDFQRWLLGDSQTHAMSGYLDLSLKALPDLKGIKLIGVSVLSFINYPYALALCKEIKRKFPQIPICMGGPFITIKDLTLPAYVDFFVKGRGEIPLEKLARHFVEGAALDYDMRGLCFRRDGRFIDNGRRHDPADLEGLPDFSDFDLARYRSDGGGGRGNISRRSILLKRPNVLSLGGSPFFMVPYRMSIGCPNQCTFCTGTLVDDLQFKSHEKVVSEIKELHSRYDNAVVVFADLSINSSHDYLSRVLDAFLGDGFKFTWISNVKFHQMSFGLLEKMSATGCGYLYWGMESAAQDMVNIYAKNFNVQKAEEFLVRASQLGIVSEVAFIFGGPGESLDSIAASKRFINKHINNKNLFFSFSRFMLEENTEMFKHPRRFGIEVVRQSHRERLLWRQEFPWKELSMGEKEFSEKQSSFKKKMARIENQFIVTRFCAGTRMDNRFFINALFVFYRAYKWLSKKPLLLPFSIIHVKHLFLSLKRPVVPGKS
jgi:radical SAM superfamily enzyme YgiQ (UPF0313 family)